MSLKFKLARPFESGKKDTIFSIFQKDESTFSESDEFSRNTQSLHFCVG